MFLVFPLVLTLMWLPTLSLMIAYITHSATFFRIWNKSTKIPINVIQYYLYRRQLTMLGNRGVIKKPKREVQDEDSDEGELDLNYEYERDEQIPPIPDEFEISDKKDK